MYKFYSDEASSYKGKNAYYLQGSNPHLLKSFFDYIDERIDKIKSISLAMYLFNNPVLFDKVKEYLKLGIQVNVISIPLEGYDPNYKKTVVNFPNGSYYGTYSKHDLAEKIYKECKTLDEKNPNFSMYIFPHMYIRSDRVRPFSRGNLPYSLHTKSFLIEYKTENTGVVGLTSSNFATRDEIKDNVLFFLEKESDYIAGKKFFNDLIDNSIKISEFNSSANYYDYKVDFRKKADVESDMLFIAPFYKDSPHEARILIEEKIRNANDRIYICAQHIAAYSYWENGKKVPGIVSAAIDAGKRNVKLNFLSQTFVDENGQSHNQRRPANTRSFQYMMQGIKNANRHQNILYYVNSLVHSKFIVVDDWAIISTCNFTPTEFIYIENVDIKKFENIPNLKYQGTFSEVGQYVAIQSKELCDMLIEKFDAIASQENTYRHF